MQQVDPAQLDQLLHPRFDPDAELNVIARGLPASPGAASGKIVFDADKAQEKAQDGEKVLLVRPETTPDDIHGIYAAEGVLTSRGGMTSHAAVVARGAGKPCVCGCEAVSYTHLLYLSLLQVEPRLEQALQQCDYKSCFELLGLLKEPVDCFFDQVLVMVEDEKLRLNRLNLLASVKSLFNRLADFSLLQLAG